MRMLSGSSQESSLPRLLRVEGFLATTEWKGSVWTGFRRVGDEVGDGMAEALNADAKVGVSVEVAPVLKLTAEIGDTSGCAMNT